MKPPVRPILLLRPLTIAILVDGELSGRSRDHGLANTCNRTLTRKVLSWKDTFVPLNALGAAAAAAGGKSHHIRKNWQAIRPLHDLVRWGHHCVKALGRGGRDRNTMSMSIQGMSKRRKYVGSQVMCHLKSVGCNQRERECRLISEPGLVLLQNGNIEELSGNLPVV